LTYRFEDPAFLEEHTFGSNSAIFNRLIAIQKKRGANIFLIYLVRLGLLVI
jgi:hypothetical protein